MVATRRSQPQSQDLPSEEEIVARDDPEESSDDDEAPEEVSLATGKQTAALQRHEERSARTKVKEDAKTKRKRQNEVTATQAKTKRKTAATNEENDDDAAADDRNVAAADAEQDEELDLLPDDVIEAIAQGVDRRPLERRIVSEQLRAALQDGGGGVKRKKKKFDAVGKQVGPVTVKVLSKGETRKASESAKAFLQQRLHGGVKRSSNMLRPKKIGGMFVYQP